MGVIFQGQFLLDESRTSVFDASGHASDYAGPSNGRERWSIASISVNSTSAVSTPQVKFYRNSVIPSNFVSGSFAGTLDVDSQPNITLRAGERLIAVWDGGDIGKTGTFHLSGTRTLL